MNQETRSLNIAAPTKPLSSKAELRRRRIIQAAAELFLNQGYERTSMDQVAERAGVSKQTVYSHFGSKQTLFVASVENRCIANELFPTFYEQDLSPKVALLKLAREFTGMLLDNDSAKLLRLCVATADKHAEVSDLFFSTGPERLCQLLTDYLTSLHEKALLNIENPRFAAQQFLYMINGEAIFRKNLGLDSNWSDQELDNYLVSCVQFFLNGYAADPANR